MRKVLLLIVMAGAAYLAFDFGTFAISGEKTDIIKMPEKEIIIDGKKPAKFKHNSHAAVNISCGECHHDDQHRPRSEKDMASLTDTDQLRCTSCHNKGGAAEKFQKRKEYFHSLCKDCHKTDREGKQGPTSCSGCHIKKKKKALEGC